MTTKKQGAKPRITHKYEELIPLFQDVSLSWNEIVDEYVRACPELAGKVGKSQLLLVRHKLMKSRGLTFPKRKMPSKSIALTAEERHPIVVKKPAGPRYERLEHFMLSNPKATCAEALDFMQEAGFNMSASTLRGMAIRLREHNPSLPVRFKYSPPGTMTGR